jgi:hypothetical protein
LICPACSSTNSGNAEFCTQCGAPLTQAARAQALASQERAAGATFESSGARDLAKEQMEADLGQARIERQQRESGRRFHYRRDRRHRLVIGVIARAHDPAGVLVVGLVGAHHQHRSLRAL